MNSSAIPATQRGLNQPVFYWLLFCAGLVLAMVVVGGLTRLSESGLSIVEWKPVSGILPPLNEAQWQASFAAYQTSPQYQKVNAGMGLAAFKGIFWLEYVHRLLGRLVGVVFLLPLVGFAVAGRLERRQGLRYLAIFALGGLQGLVGWLMVKSGLQDTPMVSPVRLALHLGIAFVIFSLLLWEALRLTAEGAQRPAPLLARVMPLAVFGQVLLGALVAGMDAGMVYNSFPSMNGYVVPPDAWLPQLGLLNPVANPVCAQLIHRLGAYAVFGLVLLAAWRLPRMNAAGERARWTMLGLVFLQFMLGVATLLGQVPLPLASLHQTGAALLFASTVCLQFFSRYAPEERLHAREWVNA